MALETNANIIIIKTIDGVDIPFIKDVLKHSKTISDMLDVNEDDSYIPLLNEKCTENIMVPIKDFMMYIHYNQNELKTITDYTEHNNTYLSDWLKRFISVDTHILFDMVIVADYLNINILMNIICKEIANRISIASPEEMNSFFIN